VAEIKISQLPEAASSTPTDYFMVIQNGVNKKVSLTTLLKTLNSGDNIQLNPAQNPINIQISSANAPYLIYVNGASDFVGVNTQYPLARFHVIGNIKLGSLADDGVVLHSEEDILYSETYDLPQGVGWFKPLNASRDASVLSVDTGVSVGQFDLSNGQSGQYKTLSFATGPTGSKATIRVLSGLGFNRIDLTNPGQAVVLKCVNIGGLPKWVCVGYYLANLYTV
jgi:hypothetical protein